LAADTLNIVTIDPFSGPMKTVGEMTLWGEQFAVDEINKAGGIKGRKIELLTRDTQGDPTKATSYAQQLLKNDKVHFIIGPVHSGECLATVGIIAKAGIPNIIIGTVDILTSVEKYPRAFRVIPTNTQWIDAVNDYDKSINLDPLLAGPFLYRAYAYLKLDKKEAAVEDFKKAANLGNEAAQEYLKKMMRKRAFFALVVFAINLLNPGSSIETPLF
jgi:tetratricopeptide (TPR) repeat protein